MNICVKIFSINVLLRVHFEFMLLGIYFRAECFFANTASLAAILFMNLSIDNIGELLFALLTLQSNGPRKRNQIYSSIEKQGVVIS
jgi:hypothetical protein